MSEHSDQPGSAPAEPGSAPAEPGSAPAEPGSAPAQPGTRQAAPEEAEAALSAFLREEQKAQSRKTAASSGGTPSPLETARPRLRLTFFRDFWKIRDTPSIWGRLFMGGLCLGLLLLAWFLATREWWGPNGDERALSRLTLGSPEEVFGSFGSLWFERAFMRHLLYSLWRVFQGFFLALLVGVPIGILCGAFKRIAAFFAPITIFGTNVPISTLVPLTMLFFGTGEEQKVMFIFMACVAFIIVDTTRAIGGVGVDYLDTAYTLGASRRQALSKVLIPLALPDIFNSARLLLGIAFGYIILAELVDAEFGVGKLILVSQRRGPMEHVYLSLLLLALVAFLLNYLLSALQRWLFPYRYARS